MGLYLATLLVDPRGIGVGGGLFNLISPSTISVVVFGSSGAFPVFRLGRWWTVLSAAWLHGSLLHLVFNLMWVRQLAPAVAEIYGPGRMVILYTSSAVTGFGLSTLAGVPNTLGASAPLFGLMGALVYSGRRGIASQMSRQVLGYAVIILVVGGALDVAVSVDATITGGTADSASTRSIACREDSPHHHDSLSALAPRPVRLPGKGLPCWVGTMKSPGMASMQQKAPGREWQEAEWSRRGSNP